MEIPFTKMHGLGNNYVYLDLFQFEIVEELLSPLAKKVSDVHTGVGSDGLILIHPSDIADVGMRIFNKDGSEGKNCGNGLRCVAKYAYEQGIVDRKEFRIETKANVVDAEINVVKNEVRDITVNMGEPELMRSEIPMIGNEGHVIAESFVIGNEELEVTAVSMGNPHAVFFVESIDQAPLYELGPIIEKDDRFPEKVNVEFIEIVSENELNFRVWERGSGVTKACGTGACAAVVAAILNGYMKRDTTICVHLSGGDLYISWNSDGFIWMTGGAEIIATGIYILNQ